MVNVEERDEKIKQFVSELKFQLKDFYPDKRISITMEKELIDKTRELLNYCNSVEDRAKNGEVFSFKKVCNDLSNIVDGILEADELKKMIDSTNLTQLLDIDPEGTDVKEYIVFMNNLVEASNVTKTNKDLEKIFSNIDIPEIIGFYQFMYSKLDEISDFLFKKPFRYTSNSVLKLVETCGILSGYYEIFIKLMISAYELVYENKPFEEYGYKQLSKKNFSSIIKLTGKIPDFYIFRKSYDRTLRNKITHKEFRIDYNNKVIIYSSQKISFKDLLIITRDLLMILISINYIAIFISRKKLQKAYQLLKNEKIRSHINKQDIKKIKRL